MLASIQQEVEEFEEDIQDDLLLLEMLI